jgi:predicted nucleotidyltransferase
MKIAMDEGIEENKSFILSDEEKQVIMKRLAGYMESREKISFAYIFGSFVDKIPFHDIDVGVYLSEIKKESATPYALDLSHFLSNALRIRTEVKVLNYAPVLFLYHVIRGRLIFERDEDIRVRIMENTIRVYLDIKPMIHRSIKEAFAA